MSSKVCVCPKYVASCVTIDQRSKSSGTNSVCETYSVPCEELSELDVRCTDSEQSCVREENVTVCSQPRSVCRNVSDESISLCDVCEEERYSICDTESSFAFSYPCEPISVCYNMVEESDPLIEELLKQLPRNRHADEALGHWEMMLHCERAAFPRVPSNLPLPSREARFYWHLYSIAGKNSQAYQKQLNHALHVTLAKLVNSSKSKKGVNIWEQLIRLKSFDRIGRRNTVTQLEQLISKQTRLESICLEGLSLTPDEGVRLLLALRKSRKTMRHVYCWRAFEKLVDLTEDTGPRIESTIRANKRIKKCDWLRAVGNLEFLTTLSVNYAYIATHTGDLLVKLAKKLGSNWHWLQLLCLEEEIIQKTAYGFHVEKVMIPEDAWEVVHFWAPVLKVQYAIIGIPQYDVHKKFFTKSTRIHTFALSTSIDLRFRQPWYLDCTLKTLCSWYSDTLVYLCLQLWHNRQNLDEQLRVLFVYLPCLRVFEFIGEIRTLKTLCAMCCQIRSGRCGVYRVHMQLQDVVHNDFDKDNWIKSVKCLMVCFKCDFDKMGVKFDIDFYCC